MNNVDSLREEAARSRRLADECTDGKLKVNLLAYAQELDGRAVRMEAAMIPTILSKDLRGRSK